MYACRLWSLYFGKIISVSKIKKNIEEIEISQLYYRQTILLILRKLRK